MCRMMLRIPERSLRACVRVRVLGVILATTTVLTAGEAGGADFYRGYAYTSDDHKLIYTESHWMYEQGGVGHRLVIYGCADGQPFARKWVDTTPGTATPDVDMLDARTGYREGVRTRGGQREVFSQADASSAEKHAPLSNPPNAVIDAGFDAFVREHWDTLSSPGVDPLPFLILSQLRYVDFSAKKLRDEDAEGRATRWFRLQLSGWYAFVLPHIDVAYDAQSRDLMEFRGISNIRGKGGSNLTVTIQFPANEHRHGVDQAEVQQAGTAPLTGHCML
jgi:hypothetical protein